MSPALGRAGGGAQERRSLPVAPGRGLSGRLFGLGCTISPFSAAGGRGAAAVSPFPPPARAAWRVSTCCGRVAAERPGAPGTGPAALGTALGHLRAGGGAGRRDGALRSRGRGDRGGRSPPRPRAGRRGGRRRPARAHQPVCWPLPRPLAPRLPRLRSHLFRSAPRHRCPCGRRRQLLAPPWCSDDASREPLRPLPRLGSRRPPPLGPAVQTGERCGGGRRRERRRAGEAWGPARPLAGRCGVAALTGTPQGPGCRSFTWPRAPGRRRRTPRTPHPAAHSWRSGVGSATFRASRIWD